MASVISDRRQAGHAESAAQATVSFDRLIAIGRRHTRLFASFMIATFLIAAIVVFTSPPKYSAVGTVLINQRAPDVLHLNGLTPEGAVASQAAVDTTTVDTQVQIMRSRALAEQVTDQFHLDRDPEFNANLRPPTTGGLQALRALLRPRTSVPGGEGDAKQREYEDVVNTVLKNLDVRRSGLTYTIDVTYTSLSPLKASFLANAFLQGYLTQGLTAKYDETTNATSWLNKRLAELRQDALNADAAVQNYKIVNNLLSAQGATLTEQEISTLNVQLAQARAQDAEQDARLRTAQAQLANGSNGGDVGEAMNNAVIGNLRGQRALASAHLADLQSRYGERYPEVLKAKRSLADIDAQIANEITRVISNLKAQSQITHQRTASLVETLSQSRRALVGNNEANVRLNELQRNSDAARAIYDAFLSRYKEVGAKEGLQPADARVMSPAKLPTSPSAPKKALGLALGVVAGSILGSIAVMVAELFDQGVTGADQAEDLFKVPVIAEVPTLASAMPRAVRVSPGRDPSRYVVEKPFSRFAETFRNLRVALLNSRSDVDVKVIAVTSAIPGEGKTTTALGLARALALGGSRVLIIDCDLRQRSINAVLSQIPSVGLLDALTDRSKLKAALVKDPASDAMLLPVGASNFTARDVFGTTEMADLLTELRQSFDAIILDTAPLLAVADTRLLAPLADVVLVLARWRRTPRKATLAALRSLEGSSAYIAGLALTQVDLREQVRSGEGAYYSRAVDAYYME